MLKRYKDCPGYAWDTESERWIYEAKHDKRPERQSQPLRELLPGWKEQPATFLKLHLDLIRRAENGKSSSPSRDSFQRECGHYLRLYLDRQITWLEYEHFVLSLFLRTLDVIDGHRRRN